MGTEREEGRNGNVSWEREGEDQCQSTSYAPVSDYIGRAYYLYSYAYVPVGTVIFDKNNHEAN